MTYHLYTAERLHTRKFREVNSQHLKCAEVSKGSLCEGESCFLLACFLQAKFACVFLRNAKKNVFLIYENKIYISCSCKVVCFIVTYANKWAVKSINFKNNQTKFWLLLTNSYFSIIIFITKIKTKLLKKIESNFRLKVEKQ